MATVEDKELDKLIDHIQNTFRIHENQDPTYVDIAGHLPRVSSSQHQIVFGRRGSGKSCLLVHYHRSKSKKDGTRSIYINADVFKILGFPDLLISIVLRILESVPDPNKSILNRLGLRKSRLKSLIRDFNKLLDDAQIKEVTEVQERSRSVNAEIGVRAAGVGGSFTPTVAENRSLTSTYVSEKQDYLERHLHELRTLLQDAVTSDTSIHFAVIIDDFYLIRQPVQPDLIDYLHRLTRGLDVYLKIGTVRYRTALQRYEEQTIGVELGQDVESIDLDRTLEDFSSTQSYLMSIIAQFGRQVGIDDFVAEYMNADCPTVLTEASGGVPRDCLTILVAAITDARERNPEASRITPRNIYRAARRGFTETKLTSMRNDVGTDTTVLERLFQDLVTFCLNEKRKTAFLIAEDEIGNHEYEHYLIQQLMDLKLIHVIEANTSAASGRQGRFEAYALDAAVFMEPRRRNIEVVEFWRTDDQGRRVGIREAPVYSLVRLRDVISGGPLEQDTESFLASADAENGQQ